MSDISNKHTYREAYLTKKPETLRFIKAQVNSDVIDKASKALLETPYSPATDRESYLAVFSALIRLKEGGHLEDFQVYNWFKERHDPIYYLEETNMITSIIESIVSKYNVSPEDFALHTATNHAKFNTEESYLELYEKAFEHFESGLIEIDSMIFVPGYDVVIKPIDADWGYADEAKQNIVIHKFESSVNILSDLWLTNPALDIPLEDWLKEPVEDGAGIDEISRAELLHSQLMNSEYGSMIAQEHLNPEVADGVAIEKDSDIEYQTEWEENGGPRLSIPESNSHTLSA